MAGESSFDAVLDRLRRGETEAAREVFQRFAGRLVAVARARLNPLLRQKTDPEDVLQSAFRSFFHHLADGEFELKSWDNLWGLLVVIALRKCHRQLRYFRGAKRDVRREVGGLTAKATSDAALTLVDRNPNPLEAAFLAETLEELMRDLDDRDRTILQLRLQGYTAVEISDRTGLTQFTIEGVLKRIRKRWKNRWNQD